MAAAALITYQFILRQVRLENPKLSLQLARKIASKKYRSIPILLPIQNSSIPSIPSIVPIDEKKDEKKWEFERCRKDVLMNVSYMLEIIPGILDTFPNQEQQHHIAQHMHDCVDGVSNRATALLTIYKRKCAGNIKHFVTEIDTLAKQVAARQWLNNPINFNPHTIAAERK